MSSRFLERLATGPPIVADGGMGALISGAVADRMKFAAWAVFIPLWALLVYSPVAHWVFALDGWLSAFDSEGLAASGINALDFAGGTAIHVNAGIAAVGGRHYKTYRLYEKRLG